jgi:hypothetical protein
MLSWTIGSDLLIAATIHLPEPVSFDGHNFINDTSYISVHYGPIYEPFQMQCEMNRRRVTSTVMTCVTAPGRCTLIHAFAPPHCMH